MEKKTWQKKSSAPRHSTYRKKRVTEANKAGERNHTRQLGQKEGRQDWVRKQENKKKKKTYQRNQTNVMAQNS